MDENKEINIFESKKNIFDSEQELKDTFNSGYKEYDFEPEAITQEQQERELKIQNLWRAIESADIKPKRPESIKLKNRKLETSRTKSFSWLETLQEISRRGLDKDARVAAPRVCKLCAHANLGQVYADEAYQDRYIKANKPKNCK